MIVRFCYLESVLLRLCVKEFEVRIRSRRFKEHSVSKLTPSGGVGRSVRNHPKKRKEGEGESERAVFFLPLLFSTALIVLQRWCAEPSWLRCHLAAVSLGIRRQQLAELEASKGEIGARGTLGTALPRNHRGPTGV